MVLRRAFAKRNVVRDILIGSVIGVGTLLLQVLWGLIPLASWQGHKLRWLLSIVIPSFGYILLHIVWRIAAAPWKVYQQLERSFEAQKTGLEASIRDLQSDLENTKSEREKVQKELRAIPGPEILIAYDQRGSGTWPHLLVANIKGGNAYNVVLRVPKDGSKFTSNTIHILKDDGNPARWEFGQYKKIDSADLVMAKAEKMPMLVSCMDAMGRRFVYRFKQPEGLGAFELEERVCVVCD